MTTQRDPVCNMQVDEKNATAQSEYQGQTYYFCSHNCKERFDKNPQQYVTLGARGAGSDR